jgi:hypothetical protein
MKSRKDENKVRKTHEIDLHNDFARIIEHNRQIGMLKRRREHNIKIILWK